MNQNRILLDYKDIVDKQKNIISIIKTENMDDLHSILRAKNLIDSYIDLQIRLEVIGKYIKYGEQA